MATLGELRPGASGEIERVTARGVLAQRLMDMGLYPGVLFRVVRNAPLKDPMEIVVDGSYLGLRHEEARYVEVRDAK